MAKSKKSTINITGWKIADITDPNKININNLSRNDLSKVVGRLVSASNKRLRNLAKTPLGRLSPSYRSRMGINRYKRKGRSYGFFSTRGKNVNELRQLYGEARGFLALETSTVKGWENVRNEITSSLGIDLSTKRKSTKFWKTYRQLAEMNNVYGKEVRSKLNSEQIQLMVAEQFGQRGGFNQKTDDVIAKMNQKITELYEQEQAQESRFAKVGSEIDGAYDEDYEDEDMDY